MFMHNLKRWAFCLLLLGGCNQERNKSIEAMNQALKARVEQKEALTCPI